MGEEPRASGRELGRVGGPVAAAIPAASVRNGRAQAGRFPSACMYTGRTERPCCLCGDHDTVSRVDLPPRTIKLLRNGDPIAWQDVVGDVTLEFCESDWELVTDLVLNVGVLPLSRCNAAKASFSLREDYEALLNATRSPQDQTEREAAALAAAADTLARDDDLVETRDLVEARLVRMALSELGVASPDDPPAQEGD